jgi:hypothetical protein
MIILRVAMDCAWRKETANEICTVLIFAQPATVHEESQGARMSLYNTEDSISGLGTPANRSDTSVEKHASIEHVSLA